MFSILIYQYGAELLTKLPILADAIFHSAVLVRIVSLSNSANAQNI